MLTFLLAVTLLFITPGPGVLSTAGMGAAYGYRAGLRYVLGLFIGTNMVALAVISGVAAVVLGAPILRGVLMAASVTYLTYLAAKIAFAGSRIAFIEAKTPPGITAGLLLQAINPKAYAVNTALITGFAFYPGNLMLETVLKLLMMNLVWVPVHLGWLWAGAALHRLDLPQRTQRLINIGMATAMLGVVALALLAALRST